MVTTVLTSVAPDSPHASQGTISDVVGMSWRRPRNGFWDLEWRVPKGSSQLAIQRPLLDEVRLSFDGSTIFWGPIVARWTTEAHVHFRAKDHRWYLSRRFVGDHIRENQISNGELTQGTLGQSPPPFWTESGADINVYNANTLRPQLTPFYAELTFPAGARDVDTRNDGEPVDSPSDPEDYHARDQSLQQNGLSTPDGGVIIFRGFSHIRDDATFGYGGKGFDGRALFAEVLNSGGQVIRTYSTSFTDQTPRNEWLRHELEIIAEPGGTVNFRLYGVAPTGAKASAVAWDFIGAYFMESLAFADGTDIVDVIEGLVDHAQDVAENKEDRNISGDPANSAVGITVPLFAYQHADHRNIWDAILDYVVPNTDEGVDVLPTWNGTHTARYVRVKSPDTTSSDTMTIATAITTDVVALDAYEDGAQVATQVLAVGPGSGPDREESSSTDTSQVGGLILEDVVTVPDGLPFTHYERFAAGQVAKRRASVRTLRVAASDSTRSSGSWADLLPGDLVSFTGTHGSVSYSSELLRVISQSWNADDELFIFELAEEV